MNSGATDACWVSHMRWMRVVMGSSAVEGWEVVRSGGDSMTWADLRDLMRVAISATVSGAAMAGEEGVVDSGASTRIV